MEMAKTREIDSLLVSELTDQVGISRSTFYYHFVDLRELIEWTISQDLYVPMRMHLVSHPSSQWDNVLRMCLERMLEHRDFYCQTARMNGQNAPSEFSREQNYQLWKLISSLYHKEAGLPEDHEDMDFIIRFIATSLSSMTNQWAKDGMDIPLDQMSRMAEVFMVGILGLIENK